MSTAKLSTQTEGEGDDREHENEGNLGEESEPEVDGGVELDAVFRMEEPCEEYSESSQERDLAERAYGSIEGGAIV